MDPFGSLRKASDIIFECAHSLSGVWLFAAPRTVAHQALLPMELFRQEYRSGVPLPTPGNLPDPRMELMSPASPASAGRFFTTSATWGLPLNNMFERRRIKYIEFKRNLAFKTHLRYHHLPKTLPESPDKAQYLPSASHSHLHLKSLYWNYFYVFPIGLLAYGKKPVWLIIMPYAPRIGKVGKYMFDWTHLKLIIYGLSVGWNCVCIILSYTVFISQTTLHNIYWWINK